MLDSTWIFHLASASLEHNCLCLIEADVVAEELIFVLKRSGSKLDRGPICKRYCTHCTFVDSSYHILPKAILLEQWEVLNFFRSSRLILTFVLFFVFTLNYKL